MKKLFIIIGILCAAFLLFVNPAHSKVVPNAVGEGGGAIPESAYSARAYQHLYERMDKYNTGSTLRLIEGESEPYTSGQQYTAWVYDNALAIIALVARGKATDISPERGYFVKHLAGRRRMTPWVLQMDGCTMLTMQIIWLTLMARQLKPPTPAPAIWLG
jgi:hypothetical protein